MRRCQTGKMHENVSRTVRHALYPLGPLFLLLTLLRLSCAVIEEEPSNIEVKVALARIFEQLGEPQRALALIKEG